MKLRRREVVTGLAAALALPTAAHARARRLPMPDVALWDPPLAFAEGHVRGPNGRIYYRRYRGRAAKAPLIVLHGGPAAGHRYLRSYAALAPRREVIFYDQSGCGKSDSPPDLNLYTVERYVLELEDLRKQLGFEHILLLGHSWGGMLAAAYAAAHPTRVRAMVLAGSAPRWQGFSDAAARWLAELGPEAVKTVKRAEARGSIDDPAYFRLLDIYYHRHLCRLHPWPAWFEQDGQAIGSNPVYVHLNGPSEFQFTGTLANYDLRPQIRRLTMPTLITCGEFDEAPAWIGREYLALMKTARLHSFNGLSHMSHIEDPRLVVATTASFLNSIS